MRPDHPSGLVLPPFVLPRMLQRWTGQDTRKTRLLGQSILIFLRVISHRKSSQTPGLSLKAAVLPPCCLSPTPSPSRKPGTQQRKRQFLEVVSPLCLHPTVDDEAPGPRVGGSMSQLPPPCPPSDIDHQHCQHSCPKISPRAIVLLIRNHSALSKFPWNKATQDRLAKSQPWTDTY